MPPTIFCSVIVIFALTVCYSGAQRKSASNYFQVCNETNTVSLAECIKSTMIALKPVIARGIPELGVQPAEPLVIDRIEMSDGHGNFKFKQILTDLKIYGLTNFEVKELKINFKNLTFRTIMHQKEIDFDGNYKMEGQILVLPLKGSGEVIFNFTDITVIFDSNLELFKKNGVDYIKIKNSKLSLNPHTAHSHFTNLFNGDKRLGDAANKFLNDHWREVFESLRELPETAFAKVISAYANNIYTKFPLKELFPSYDLLK